MTALLFWFGRQVIIWPKVESGDALQVYMARTDPGGSVAVDRGPSVVGRT